jgi:hypothetical protein
MLAVFLTDAQQSIMVDKLPPVSITRDCFDRIALISSVLLTIAGFIGIFLAWKTVSATKKAAEALYSMLRLSSMPNGLGLS